MNGPAPLYKLPIFLTKKPSFKPTAMKKYQIHLDDWQRILIGDVPATFYIEIVIRAALIYIILVASMRLMGRRMASQLSRIEMAAMVSLAAAIGVPMQAPDRGLLPAVVIAFVVISVERLISYFASKNEKFEQISQDDMDILLEDSILKTERMQRTRITRDRLCAHLRSEGLTNLGAVKRVYMEANGAFSIVKESEPKPGLCIIPEWDQDFVNQLQVTDLDVCANCGKAQKPEYLENTCSNCGNNNWAKGVMEVAKHKEVPEPEFATN
jgi:uncharacterized membrane protein YcaP (DUF421 family)